MRRNPWFETVAEAQRRAEKHLPSTVYGALVAGSERGLTIDDNLAAFGELGFAPRVVGHHAERDLSTTVMGVETAFPVLISPTGVQAVHPDGEVAVARAAANRGVIMGLSSFASKPVEEVTETNPDTFFQLYWSGTRDTMVQRMDRARAAGAKGLIVTLDWSFSHGRDWGSPAIPAKIDLKTMVRLTPNVVTRPRWLWKFAKSGRIPDLTVPNLKPSDGGPTPTFFAAYHEWMQTTPPTWNDVKWLREEWGGPFLLKGVSRVDDAKRAVDAGVTALSVSNHGGNNLDTTPASIRFLPSIVEAVGADVEVLLDGGIRRGGDMAKALALGARAVMIGRAYLWGLAANGQAGVENVLDILRGGLDSAVLGLGRASVHELSPEDLVIPPGFTRTLGAGKDTTPSAAFQNRASHAWPTVPPKPLVLVPIGSTEQHGPHLPLETDSVIARAVAERAAKALPGPAVVAPILPYSASGEHAHFPGTVSIGHEALHSVLVEMVRSLSLWAGSVVFVNGHGGNAASLRTAVSQMREEGHDVAWTGCGVPGSDAHAGRTETSLMMHLAPEDVSMDAAVAGDTRPLATLMPDLIAQGVRAISPSGVLGDPTGASAEEGRGLLDLMVSLTVRRMSAGITDSRGHLVEPETSPSAVESKVAN